MVVRGGRWHAGSAGLMLSYRHAFHAGNHADVLKHLVLVELLSYLTIKDKRLVYIDTHAGAGSYRLDGEPTATKGEFKDGIGRLLSLDPVPDGLRKYLDLIRSFNRDGNLRRYPGSPKLAYALLGSDDLLRLSELHTADHAALEQEFRKAGSRVRIVKADGFAELKALLPPLSRRALVMIDPSYEMKKDYTDIVTAIADARRRFATGVYACWYPLLSRPEAQQLPARLRAVAGNCWLDVQLTVGTPTGGRSGLYGSGMLVINPPHTLPGLLKKSLPGVAQQLARQDDAGFELDYQIP